MMEMAVLAEDDVEVRTLLRAKPPFIEPTELIFELEITGETEAEKRKHISKSHWTVRPKTNVITV